MYLLNQKLVEYIYFVFRRIFFVNNQILYANSKVDRLCDYYWHFGLTRTIYFVEVGLSNGYWLDVL